MDKIVKYILLLALLYSCKDQPEIQAEETPFLTVETDHVSFSAEQGTRNIPCSSNAKITATSSSPWCFVTIRGGGTTIEISVPKNTGEKRTATISVTADQKTASISVEQAAEGSSDGDNQYISYSQFGAVGDGITDDLNAIISAHSSANMSGLPVRADAGATYYIGGAAGTALIRTDTDWGDAKFIIDDTNVENKDRHIFNISSSLAWVSLLGSVTTLKKDQESINLRLAHKSFVVVRDHETRRFIRVGANQNSGNPQTDVFVVDESGNVDKTTPIIWDFDNITNIIAYPIDEKTLTVRGGHFTTIANQEESNKGPYSRGIFVNRSNVVISDIHHAITGELIEQGASYGGFIDVANCTNVTVENCFLSGHRFYSIIGNAGVQVAQGTYDIVITTSTDITFRNCGQINDIHNTSLWGILGSNFSKNITLDHVEFSRFDAHMGVTNATIKNSIMGHHGINLIGNGVFLIENTKVCGNNLINLRADYGSTFNGEIIIRNCEFFPRNGRQSDAVLINGSNSGQHDFGYTCYMPQKITIDGLVIDDSNPVNGYQGPKIFTDFNPEYTSEAYIEQYPYVITEEIVIEGLTVRSGKPYVISANPFMFRNVKITEK